MVVDAVAVEDGVPRRRFNIFAAILALTEFLIVKAAKSWFPDQLYTVSVTAAVTAIIPRIRPDPYFSSSMGPSRSR